MLNYMQDQPKKELKDLQVGDSVIYRQRWQLPGVVAIRRITPTRIIVAPDGIDELFRRDNGRAVGGDASSALVSAPNPGEVEQCRADIRHKRLEILLKDADYSALPLSTLEQIYALTKKETCKWTFNDCHGYYDTSCGEGFHFDDDRLTKKIKFCPYCGKSIEEEK